MIPWTNQALAPSRLESRPAADTVKVMDMLGVPQCAFNDLRDAITGGKSFQKVTCTEHGCKSLVRDYYPVMDMSYATKGNDYAYTTIVAPGVTADGVLVPVRCGGEKMAVAFWEKCGNISVLAEAPTGTTDFGRNGGSAATTYVVPGGTNDLPHNTVPEPGTGALVALALAVGYFSRGKK